jgi:hypothetical protein
MLGKFKFSRHPIRCTHPVTCRACARNMWVQQLELCMWLLFWIPWNFCSFARGTAEGATCGRNLRSVEAYGWNTWISHSEIRSWTSIYSMYMVSVCVSWSAQVAPPPKKTKMFGRGVLGNFWNAEERKCGIINSGKQHQQKQQKIYSLFKRYKQIRCFERRSFVGKTRLDVLSGEN